jgi:glucose-1-phosphate cytidylyltransferase
MKVVILAGGLGSRIAEHTDKIPKPMIEIQGKPILWHIMKIYSQFGLNEFIICCGYKSYIVKEYFCNYLMHTSDITLDMEKNKMTIHKKRADPWKVTLIDTGINTMTGGRLKRISNFIDSEEFCFTYGDGVAEININDLINFHKSSNKLATLTAARAPGRFGALKFENENIVQFNEKIVDDSSWVNAGFFVLNKKILEYIDGDFTIWEKEPLEKLAKDNQLQAFKHYGFWQPMDTLRDKNYLEDYLNKNKVSWLR